MGYFEFGHATLENVCAYVATSMSSKERLCFPRRGFILRYDHASGNGDCDLKGGQT